MARLGRYLLLLTGTVVASGCGLGDYEQRLDEERARVKNLQEEATCLDEVLDMPTVRSVKFDPKAQPLLYRLEAFVRPPKGIARAPDHREKPATSGRTELYRWAGGADVANVFLAADNGQLTPRQFQQEVRGALSAWSLRANGRPLKFADDPVHTGVTRQRPQARGEKVPALRFELLNVDEDRGVKEPYRYAIYHYRNEEGQLAIVFQVPLSRTADVTILQQIDHCLKWVGVGPAEGRARADEYYKQQESKGVKQ